MIRAMWFVYLLTNLEEGPRVKKLLKQLLNQITKWSCGDQTLCKSHSFARIFPALIPKLDHLCKGGSCLLAWSSRCIDFLDHEWLHLSFSIHFTLRMTTFFKPEPNLPNDRFTKLNYGAINYVKHFLSQKAYIFLFLQSILFLRKDLLRVNLILLFCLFLTEPIK